MSDFLVYRWSILSARLTLEKSLRGQIGVVPQAPILFDDTIMNNVKYAKLSATDDEVYEACKAASIHDQVLGFTEGMSGLEFISQIV